jgi:hypothetical protein
MMKFLTTRITCALFAFTGLMPAFNANAGDLGNVGSLTQGQFNLLAEDVGSALSYTGGSAGATLSLPGIDLSYAFGASRIQNRAIWEQARTSGSVSTYLPLSTLGAVVHLPFNLDLAGQYVVAHSTDLRVAGAQLRWGFLPETLTTPSMSATLSYSRLLSRDDISFDSVGIGLGISKKLLVVTPYGGVGRFWSKTKATNVPTLRTVSNQHNRVYVGVRFNFLLNFAIEASRTGNSTTYGINYGLSF